MKVRVKRRDRKVSTVWRILPDGSGVERVETYLVPACGNGHPFSGDNVLIRANGTRLVCRECERERSRSYVRRHRALTRASAA